MEITILDYLVFFIFVGGVALFGCSFYFRSRKGAAAFTTAEGSLPTWVVGMSIFATFVSSISFLGLPGDAYKGNWNPFVFSLSIPIATWLAAKVFIPLYRGINSVSAYHYLEMRFGYWARCYVAVCYLLTQLARVGSILLLLALPLNTMFDWDIQTIIICTGIATLIYTLLGGIAAVVWTDAIQGIILIVGAVACAAILTSRCPKVPDSSSRSPLPTASSASGASARALRNRPSGWCSSTDCSSTCRTTASTRTTCSAT